MSIEEIWLALTKDEVLVLREFCSRWQETGTLGFAHAAEYMALTRVAAQLDGVVQALSHPQYSDLLKAARDRVAGYYTGEHEDDYPGPRVKDI
jgi:hypothetical protein